MALDPQQQAQLYAAKLRSLVRNRLGFELDDSRGLSDGAIGESDDASAVAYLVEESPRRSLGRAIAAGIDRDADTVHLLCASEAGLVARRASAFSRDIRVWEIRDTELVAASPQPHVVSEAPSADVLGLSADIVAAGADPVVEHGILRGEVRGLEIVRVELFDGAPELRVGVGDFDREAFGLLHGAQPKMDAIAEVVSIVTEQR